MTLPPAESLVTIDYAEAGDGLFATYAVTLVLAHPSGAPSLAKRITVATASGKCISANAKNMADDRAADAANTIRAWLREIGAAL